MRISIPKDRALRFFRFVRERENVRVNRFLGREAPWTKDPILQRYRFCNVRRRDDRVSQWIEKHVIMKGAPEGGRGLMLLGQFLALCRFVNWPPMIQILMDQGLWPHQHPNWKKMGLLIDARVKAGEKAWTGAYMVRAERPEQAGGRTKGSYVAEIVVGRELTLAEGQIRLALRERSRRAVHEVLMGCYGWGSFMAGQVVDDWSWTPLLFDAEDHLTWAPLGPGSERGLNRLYGQNLKVKLKPEIAVPLMRELRNYLIYQDSDFRTLTLMDVQNCLCEYDKYSRVQNGEGRPRSLYHPETAY